MHLGEQIVKYFNLQTSSFLNPSYLLDDRCHTLSMISDRFNKMALSTEILRYITCRTEREREREKEIWGGR